MTEGPLLGKIIRYSIPLIATGMLQLLYNAADTIVAGRYAPNGEAALGAVGSCGALINLIVNLFMGLSVGAGVCVAHDYGARKFDDVRRTVHTAVPTAAILGVIVSVFGFFMSETLLKWTGVQGNILQEAVPYMKAYMLGMPASMVYNYCATMLRSKGDTKHPLIFLSISGIANILLNLLMVIVFKMGAVGVGIATAVSTWLSMFLIIGFMLRSKGSMKLEFKLMRFHKDKFFAMLRFGIPAGLQGCVFSLSNVLIQSSINMLDAGCDFVVAGNAAAANIDGFIYIAMNSIYHAALTFVGQNVGAKKYHRIGRIMGACAATVGVIGITMSAAAVIFGRPLLSLYAPGNENAIAFGMIRMSIVSATYFLCGFMELGCGVMRGLGNSLVPMIVSVVGSCAFRIVWIYTVFAAFPTAQVLYLSYPFSWLLTAVAHFICSAIYLRIIKKRDALLNVEQDGAKQAVAAE
ncbi:MAG: MATE family efflux transporter [Clostridia bacterium]|nr:MATE family efflux transporter [Clostridia bacterium]